MERYFKCYDIDWDTDGEDPKELGLEDTIEVCVYEGDVEDFDDEDELSDVLGDLITDQTGYCHFGFEFHEVV